MPADVISGDSPLIIAFPNASTEVARPVLDRMSGAGLAMTDTDWHIDRLVSGLVEDATTVRANFHRYVCNADADPSEIGPGSAANPIAVVPLRTLDGHLIWDAPPDAREMARWSAAFHAPYHAALAAQVARVRARHGFAMVIDCHAARSEIPARFEGRAPDIGIRTHRGLACDPKLGAHVASLFMREKAYTTLVSERVRTGWTVRRHGQPKRGIHALQLVFALSTYLTEEADPWLYDPQKAAPLRQLIADALGHLKNWQPEHLAFHS